MGRMYCPRTVIVAASMLLALSAARGAAAAPVLFSYSGNRLTTAAGVGDPDANFLTIGTEPDGISQIAFEMIGTLDPDRAYSRFVPDYWAISDGVSSFSSLTPVPNLLTYFEFATDSVGNITEWFVDVQTYNTTNPAGGTNHEEWNLIRLGTVSAPATGTLFPYDLSTLCSAVSCDFGRADDYRALSYGDPGTWTVQPTDVLTPVPEPGAMLLTGAGMAVLVTVRRRRSPRRPR
jgi:hypothetical protein